MELIKTSVNYQTDINIGLIGIKKDAYEDEIKKLEKSLLSKGFILDKHREEYGKYIKSSFKKINEKKIIKIINNEINDNNGDLIINIYYCDSNLDNDKKKYYEEFLKEKLDYYLLYNSENYDSDFLNLISKYSKGNYFKVNYNTKATSIKSKDILLDFEIIDDPKSNIDYNIFKLDKFLENLISKFEMFHLFQKYSVEKNIVNFKDYLYTFHKYSVIKDEKELIKLFNKFEKLSFNNDYADNTLILLQLMIYKNKIFKNNFAFNVKSLKCGFCTEQSNICEFDKNLQTFLCIRCRLNKTLYDKIAKK